MFGNKSSGKKARVTEQKTVGRRGNQQLDYFKAKLSGPVPPARNGIDSFRGRKKR